MSLTTSKNKCLICKREMEQPYGYKDSKLLVVLHKPFRELYGSLSAAIETTLLTELTRAGFGSSEIGITSLLKHSIGPEFYKETNHFEWHILETIKEMNCHEKILLLGSDLPRVFVGDHLTDASSIFGIPMSDTKYFREKVLLFGPSLEEAVATGIGELRDVIELRKSI